MASSQAFIAVVLCLLTFGQKSTMAQTPPVFVAGGEQLCNYQYAIPSGDSCLTYMPALEKNVESIQQDLDRFKLQYFSQNNFVQEQLTRLPALENQVQSIAQNVSSLTAQVTTLVTNSLTMTVEQRNDHQELEDLQVQVSFLSRQLATLKNELRITNPTLPTTTTTRPTVPRQDSTPRQ